MAVKMPSPPAWGGTTSSFLGPTSQSLLRNSPGKAPSCIFRKAFENDLRLNTHWTLTESSLRWIFCAWIISHSWAVVPSWELGEDQPLSAQVRQHRENKRRNPCCWEDDHFISVPYQLCPSADVHQGFSKQHENLPGCPMFSTACQELLKWHIQTPRQRLCRNFDLDRGSQKLQLK